MGKSLAGGFGRLTLFGGRTAAASFDFIIRQPSTAPAMPHVRFLAFGEVRHAR